MQFGEECASFFPKKHLTEAKLESFGLLAWAAKISRQFRLDNAMLLLVITLTRIYNKKAEKGQIQNIPFGRKCTPDSLNEKYTMLKMIKTLNKCLILNGRQE